MSREWVPGSRLRMTRKVEYDEYVLDIGSEGTVNVVDDGDMFVAWDASDAPPSWLMRSDSDNCVMVSQGDVNNAKGDVNSDLDSGPPSLGNVKLFGIFGGHVRLQSRLVELMLPLDYECPIDLVLPLLNHFITVGRQDKDKRSNGAIDQDDERPRRVQVADLEELRAKLLLEMPDSQIENLASKAFLSTWRGLQEHASDGVMATTEQRVRGGQTSGCWCVHERTGEFASRQAMKRIWSGLDSKLGELYTSTSPQASPRLPVSPREVDQRDEFWKTEYEGIKRELSEKQRSLESSKRELARLSRQLSGTGPSSAAQDSGSASWPNTSFKSQPRGLNSPTPARTLRSQPESAMSSPVRVFPWTVTANSSMLSDIGVRDEPLSPLRNTFAVPAAPSLRNSASSGQLGARVPAAAKVVASASDRAGFVNDVAALREIARKNPELKALDENPWFPDSVALDSIYDSAEQIGSWKGIVVKGGRVTEIHIRVSCLPSAVGRLSALTVLDLTSSVSLQTLPDSVGDLRCLDALKLGACRSLGVLPGSLARLQSLTRLDLWHCACLSMLPAALPKSLKVLNLSGCTGLLELPDSLRECAYLQAIDVKGCSSLAPLPAFFGDMPGLTCSRGVEDVRNRTGDRSPALS